MFRSDLFNWFGLIAWYLVSMLLGCLAGYAGGLLISRIPARLNPLAAYVAGALFGIFAYLAQVYVLLIFVFRTTSWE